jgi:hypothetical protein
VGPAALPDPSRGIPILRRQLQPRRVRPRRVGRPGQGRRREVCHHHLQAPRRLLDLRQRPHRLRCHEGQVREGHPRPPRRLDEEGGDPARLLLFDHGLAPSRLPAPAGLGKGPDGEGRRLRPLHGLRREPAQGARFQVRPGRDVVRRRVGALERGAAGLRHRRDADGDEAVAPHQRPAVPARARPRRLRDTGELRPGDRRPQPGRDAPPLGGLLHDELERLGLQPLRDGIPQLEPAHPPARRDRQQGRQPPAQRRAPARRPDPGRLRRPAKADRRVAPDERRGDLRDNGQHFRAASLFRPLHRQGHDALRPRHGLAAGRKDPPAGAQDGGPESVSSGRQDEGPGLPSDGEGRGRDTAGARGRSRRDGGRGRASGTARRRSLQDRPGAGRSYRASGLPRRHPVGNGPARLRRPLLPNDHAGQLAERQRLPGVGVHDGQGRDLRGPGLLRQHVGRQGRVRGRGGRREARRAKRANTSSGSGSRPSPTTTP